MSLLEKASIITTPTAYDDGKLLSVKPVGGENLLLQSNQFDTTWGKNNVTLTSGQQGYDGTSNAWLLNKGTDAFTNLIQSVTSSGLNTFSVYAKSGTLNELTLRNSATNIYARFNLSNGTLIQENNTINTLIQNIGNGWFRCSITTNISAASLQIYPDWSQTSSGNIYIQNAQLERGSKANTYIETTTTAIKNGDFSFTRGSSATRVNEQGLVSDVQILSGELVQNGDFEEIGSEEVSNGDFEQIGSELVVNGDFATDSDWTKQLNWTIANGSANSNGTGLIYQTSVSYVDGKTYKVTFDASITSGTGTVRLGNTTSPTPFTNGANEFYLQTDASNTTRYIFFQGNSLVGSIDNVSVKEVGQDWTFGAGWSMSDGKAVHTGVQSLLTQNNVFTSGIKYKISFDLTGADSFNYVRLLPSHYTGGRNFTTSGTNVVYVTANVSALYIYGVGDVSIDNVSVKEVGQNWVFGTGWSIEDGKAYRGVEASGSNLQQNSILTIGKKYKVTLDVLENIGTNIVFIGSGTAFTLSGTGTQTFTGNCSSNTTLYIQASNHNSEVKVDNISVIEITDDTDLPRINYTNFDYENGEVVPYSGEGSLLLEPQSTNTATYSNDYTQGDIFNGSSTPSTDFSVLTQNQGTAPDGTNTAQKLTDINDGNVGGILLAFNSTNLTSGTSTISMFVKKDTVRYFVISFINFDTDQETSFDLDTGTVNRGEGVMTYYGNGWYRCSATITTTTDLIGSIRFYITENSAATGGTTRNGTKSTFLWALQAEEQLYATSYIPTEGSIKTRLQDIMPFNANPIKTPTSNQAVLYLEIATTETTNRTFGGFVGSSSMYGLYHWADVDNNKFGFNSWNGDCYGFTNADFLLDGNFHKIAALFDFTDFTQNKLFIDGTEYSLSQVRGTTIQRSANALALGAPSTNQIPIASYKIVALFDEALSDSELSCLTS